ncbi:MAG: BolA family protein [Pseudomonadota bacterium]
MPDAQKTVAETIREKLVAALAPAKIEIVDESHLHAGHAGAPEGGESHFRILIIASAFDGASRVERQRKVNAILKDELAGPVHALAMKTLTPQEADA